MRSHVPLCVLPPCASSLPLGGPHQRPDVIPGQPLQPACVILHASGPTARSFLSPLQSSRCGRPSFFFPAVSLLYPCPTSIRLPATGLLCRTLPPCGGPARQTDIRLPRGIICPTSGPPLPCLPDLSLPVEHTHIAVSCHFASSRRQAAPIKRRGRKAGASLPPVSAAVTAHHKSCPRCT